MSAEPKAQILVCDDEPHLREMVSDYLEERGYGVRKVANGDELLRVIERSKPDLILLDITMPGTDGLTALRMMRVQHDVPVIMLTASAEIIDRVVGLEMGADDYLGKPVDLRELEARVKSVLRRLRSEPSKGTVDHNTKVEFGRCVLDLKSAKLFDQDGKEIDITAMEFALLKVFSANRGRVLNRDQLLEQAHDRGWEPFDRSIDLRISRLRRKIEANPSKPEIIRTVRGMGYIFG